MTTSRNTTTGRWQTAAACAGTDPRLFTDPRTDTDDTDRAIAICRRCVVCRPCLAEALDHPADVDVGIWGATTPEDRRTLRRQQQHPASTRQPTATLFPTLDGELTDLTGQALVVTLPTPPSLLLLLGGIPTLRTDRLDTIRRHIGAVDVYQPARLAPLALDDAGNLTDPTGRVAITRLPVAPHLLVVVDGRARRRGDTLDQAHHHARQALARLNPPPAGLNTGHATAPIGQPASPTARS
jgi:WhiB family transcriptional regulator, redox-sensing transcriptional regulator